MLTDRSTALGKYRLIAEIARGGMGVVYLAMAQGPGGFHKLLVVKELRPELVEEPTFLTMFLDEARLAARLSHPNIVQTNEVGSDGDRYFLAMEYLDGRGFDHLRRRARAAGAPVPLALQLRILADMLAGLDYAHHLTDFDGTPLDIVHRDVSPQNVFVTFDGQVKLLDFGIAKAADSSHETHAGILKGKVAYMAPEQARGQKVDARADVFAAGVMLWEALTGQRLRQGQNDQQKLWALVASDLPRASSVKPAVPPELDAICARAMAPSRDDRYESAGEFQAALESYLAATGPVSTRELGAFVSELYRDDRARTNALIEAHVARARSGADRAELPIIDVSARAPGGTPSQQRGSLDELVSGEHTGGPRAAGAQASAAGPSGARAVARPRSRRPLIIGSVVAAAALGVGLPILWPSDVPAPQAAGRGGAASPAEPAVAMTVTPTPAPATGHAAPAAPGEHAPPGSAEAGPHAQAASKVTVEIRVTPASATLSIDDVEVASNPYTGTFVSDSAPHRIRATAPGYVGKSLAVVFDANVSLDLSLEHLAAPPARITIMSRPARATPAARPAAPRPTSARAEPTRVAVPEPGEPREPRPAAEPRPAPKPAAEVDPAGGSRPRRPIDPTNPYGGE